MSAKSALFAPRAWSTPIGVLLAFVGVALPLLPVLPGVMHYASPLQALEIYGQMGLVFAITGLLVAVLCALAPAVVALALRRPAGAMVLFACASVNRLLVAVFLVQAVRTWLFYVGWLPAAMTVGKGFGPRLAYSPASHGSRAPRIAIACPRWWSSLAWHRRLSWWRGLR